MAINFTSWTDCDWQGGYTLDWTSAATLYERNLIPYVDALRQACLERWAAYTTSTGGGTRQSLELDTSTGTVPLSLTAQGINSAIFTFLSGTTGWRKYWVNHHDVGVGGWVGKTTAPPAWTEATMLAQIGDATRLAPVEKGVLSKEWAIQVYKILNQILWFKSNEIPNEASSQYKIFNTPFDTDWPTTWGNLPAWGSTGWTNGTGGDIPTLAIIPANTTEGWWAAVVGIKKSSQYAEVIRLRTKWQSLHHADAPKADIDFYVTASGSLAGFTHVFDAASETVSDGLTSIFETIAGTSGGVRLSSYFTALDTLPPEPTAPPPSNSSKGWFASNLDDDHNWFSISKWNVTDGFTFVP